jgi:hypothetical protein
MIKLKVVFILTFLCNLNLYGQSKTKAEDIFKMHLFLDKKNITRSDLEKNVIKNDSLFDSFKKNCSIKIDTLKMYSNIYLPIDGSFKFYVISDIEYKNELSKVEMWFLKIDLNLDYKYVIAINESTGRSYCLSGFNNNDFFVFFSDISNAYRSFYFKKLKISNFLKNYKVENLDFECLYKSIKSDVIDKERFPCLKTPNDSFSIH